MRTDEATATGSRSEAEDEDDEDYVPYVPLRQRRQLLVRAPGRAWGGVWWSELSVVGTVAPRQTWDCQPDLRVGQLDVAGHGTLSHKPGS